MREGTSLSLLETAYRRTLIAGYLSAAAAEVRRAVEQAQKAIELTPKHGNHWNTLGQLQF